MTVTLCQLTSAHAVVHKPLSQSRHRQAVCVQLRPKSRRSLQVHAEDPNKVIREFSEETGKTFSEAKQTIQQNMKKKMQDEYLGLGGSPNQPLRTNYFLVISLVIASLAIISKLAGYI